MLQTSVWQLCKVLGIPTAGRANKPVSGVSIDSRTIQPGNVFFALIGPNFDGHQFVSQAFDKGAACAVVSRQEISVSAHQQPLTLKVADTVHALSALAGWYRRQLSATVVAITGSVGKTTCRHLLYSVLSRHMPCHQAVKSFNNHIGVPLTLLATPAESRAVIVEIGTNHPGEIAPLSRLAMPQIACVTCVAPAHLEGFGGSFEALLAEKASIAEGLPEDGILIVNGDQPELVNGVRGRYRCRIITVGTTAGCDVLGSALKTDGLTGSLTIEGTPIHVPLAGEGNLRNVLTVWSICRLFDISLSDFASAIAAVPPPPMRMQIDHIGTLTVLNDCYNANPASMQNALKLLGQLAAKEGRRAVFIAGTMAELGNQSDIFHHQIGKFAVENGIRLLLAVGTGAQGFVAGAKEAGIDDKNCHIYENTDNLCIDLCKHLQPADIVLVKGSRLNQLEKAITLIQDQFGQK